MNEFGTIYRFGEYELCPQTRDLLRNGKRVKIQERIFCLLSYLVANSDRAITKDELIDAVWEGKPVSETVIPRAVMKARRAIGDNGDLPKSIRTIRGYGYRFTETAEIIPCYATESSPAVTVQDVGPSGEAAVKPSALHDGGKKPRSLSRDRMVRCLFVLAVLAFGIFIGDYISSCP